jgi:uncharacterized protein YlxW (UPF0749 family)
MNKKTLISFTLVLLVLGFLLGMQFKTQQRLINSLAYQDARDLITIYNNMREKLGDLNKTANELKQSQSDMELEVAQGVELIELTNKEISQLRIINGEVAVEGPGISITITRDAPLLHYDLIDLINELWVSGAEAIAINDHRVTATTHIKQAGLNEITINNETLLFPYTIKAIGDPHTLEKGLTFTGGLIENWTGFYGIYPSIAKKDRLSIPPG